MQTVRSEEPGSGAPPGTTGHPASALEPGAASSIRAIGSTGSARPNLAPAPSLPTAILLAPLVLAAALAVTAGSLRAQAEADTARADTARPPADTARGIPAEPDTAAGPPVTPLGAFARSFVLPGWGQAEVDQPVRGAVYFALESASLWMVFKSQARLSSARRGLASDTAGLVEARVGSREDWIVISAFVALMSGVDAWVSTHLHGFEAELEPPEDGTPGAQVTYRIPLRLP